VSASAIEKKKRKKIMFYETEERQISFRIRCQQDELTQSEFLRMMVTGYIENDSLIFEYIDQQKEKLNLQGRMKRDKSRRVKLHTEQNAKKFSLDKNEIEDIFDMIEMETDL
jgi:hypothetical protein